MNSKAASHLSIPILADMGVEILESTPNQVRLQAPLEANRNHQGTAFGGSLYSLAVMSCWALLNEKVQSLGFKVESLVIQDGQMKYLTPIQNQFIAIANWPDPTDGKNLESEMLKALQRKGLARVDLRSRIEAPASILIPPSSAANTCCEFQGRFVVSVSRTHS